MANTPVFTLLCSFQFVIGFLMLVFGIADKVEVKIGISYIMLPIWIGILTFIAGISGLLVGNQHLRRGFLASHMVSGLRAINILCAAVSFFALYCYASLFAGLSSMLVQVSSQLANDTKLQTIEGTTAAIMILSVAEMFCGIWLALFNKEGIFVGSTPPIQNQLPVQYNDMQNRPLDQGHVPMPGHNPTAYPSQQQQVPKM